MLIMLQKNVLELSLTVMCCCFTCETGSLGLNANGKKKKKKRHFMLLYFHCFCSFCVTKNGHAEVKMEFKVVSKAYQSKSCVCV